MSHILNHNRVPFEFKIDRSNCWDFFLDGGSYSSVAVVDGLTERCLVASVNMDDCDSLFLDDLKTASSYYWGDFKNSGLVLDNIGLTGMDNGTILFNRHTITVEEFNKLYGDSHLTIEEGDPCVHFRKVGGNNGIFSYMNDIVVEDGLTCSRLNGGFWQGFFKSGNDYQVLPTNIGDGVCLEFIIKPNRELEDDSLTMNDRYPSNKGIFFYIGTRAENKWYRYAEHEETFMQISNTYFGGADYNDDDYFSDVKINPEYFDPRNDYTTDDGYFTDAYTDVDCTRGCESLEALHCGCIPKNDPCRCQRYFVDKYFDKGSVNACICIPTYITDDYTTSEDEDLIPDTERETTGGHSLSTPNIYEIESDNKFLMFDRTCTGITADKWVDGTTALITDVRADNRENYFILYHRGCNGLLADKTWNTRGDKRYDINEDLYRNAFALKYSDDGSVGFKYMVKNCDCDGDDCTHYSIVEESTVPNLVNDGEWSVVHVKLLPVGKHYGKCDITTSAMQKMRILIYVNGHLKLISKEVPQLNLRKLNEMDDKQEGVPFNLSLGGGTQGLSDVVYYDYTKTPTDVLPLEREFGGSFVGYFHSFRMYTCELSLSEMMANVNHFRGRL